MDICSTVVDVEGNHYACNTIVPVSNTPEHEIADQWENPKKEMEHITLGDRLGIEEIFSPMVWRRSLAELFGTATLAFMTNAIMISSYEIETNTPKLTMLIVIPITVALIVLVTVPVTGGHINPTVSMAFGLMGRIPLCRAAIYILAQCMGGILGALTLKVVIDNDTERTFSLGGCTVVKDSLDPKEPSIIGLDTARAIYLEVVCSFIFLFISRWLAFDARKANMFDRLIYCLGIGIAVAFNGFLSTTITGANGYTGVGVNPARCLGPAIVKGGHLWYRHWIYWLGPAIGSMSYYLYTWIVAVENTYENKHDFINVLKSCRKVIHYK